AAEGPQAAARRRPPFRPRGRRQGGGAPRARGRRHQSAARPIPRFPRSLGQPHRDRRLQQYSIHQGAARVARDRAGASVEDRQGDQGASRQGHGPELTALLVAYAISSAVAASSTSIPPVAATRPASSSTTEVAMRLSSPAWWLT